MVETVEGISVKIDSSASSHDEIAEIKTQLLEAFKSTSTHSNDSIDRSALRTLLHGFCVTVDESEDVVDPIFQAMGVGAGGRCCIHKLFNALQPHFNSSAKGSNPVGEVIRTAIRSFLDAAKLCPSRIAPDHGQVPDLQSLDSPPAACSAACPDTADLEAQRRTVRRWSGARCAAAVCCALVIAAAITFGIFLAVAKMGRSGGS